MQEIYPGKGLAVDHFGLGTLSIAGMVGKYWFEFRGGSVEIDVASELRYRNPVYPKMAWRCSLSQSSETAGTPGGARDAKAKGQKTITLVAAHGWSSIAPPEAISRHCPLM